MRRVIRKATIHDLEPLVQLAHDAHGQSAYSWIIPNEQKARGVIAHLIQTSLVLVVVDDGFVVGCLIGLLTPMWWADGYGATDLLLWVRPQAKGAVAYLYKRLIAWGKQRGALAVSVFVAQGYYGIPDKLHKLLIALGFTRAGSLYILPLTKLGEHVMAKVKIPKAKAPKAPKVKAPRLTQGNAMEPLPARIGPRPIENPGVRPPVPRAVA